MLGGVLTEPPEAPVERVERGARPALQRSTTVAWLLDDAVELPGTDRTFGIDAAIGIVPVLGDLFAAGISWYILLEAVRFRVPPRVLGRMVFNVVVDFLLGFLPVIGFFLDVLWAANERNAALLTDHLLERYRLRDGAPGTDPDGDPGEDTGGDAGW